MNRGKIYDYATLIKSYLDTLQNEITNTEFNELNIVRQIRYIKETTREIENELGMLK